MVGRHFGAAYTGSNLTCTVPAFSQPGSYLLVAALACVGYSTLLRVSGLFVRNPMIRAAVLRVRENLNPFLPALPER